MHSPMTVAFDVPNPFLWERNYKGQLRPKTLATIWHVDPEKDGTDDSCGWFMRGRHCDQARLKQIEKDFAFEWSHGCPNGWFAENGEQNYSTHAIALAMFRIATGVHFGHWSRAQQRFLRKHLWEILHFAENNTDSLHTFIQQSFGRDPRETTEERVKDAARMIYSWVCREARPRWRHPKWHIHHWKIQVHPIQSFKRWAFSRCCHCGKRFKWGQSATTHSWHSTGPLWFRSEQNIFHSECSGAAVQAATQT